MAFAIIKIANKQFLVEQGDVFEMERQEKPLKCDVLLYSDGKNVQVGQPILDDVKVSVEIVEDKLDKKIRVGHFKSKSRYDKVMGHRQPISVIKVTRLNDQVEVKEEPAEKKVAVKKPPVKKLKKETAK